VSRATIRPGRPLRGACDVPGDKSITQRAILLGALATGETRIVGANVGADARAALGIVRALGSKTNASESGVWRIRGGSLRESSSVLDARNSGTALRLSMGLLSAQPFLSVLTGDSSLRNRPVGRVIEPLRALGADLAARGGDRFPPVSIRGGPLRGAPVRTPVASAQVKSAILLAAVQAEGETVVEEPKSTRDHTERMLPSFGCPIAREGTRSRVEGRVPLHGTEIRVPGDPSAAAFLLAAAALVPGSDLTLRGIGINPTRRAFMDLLAGAGARLETGNERGFGGEPVADLRIRPGALGPFRITALESGPLIDELPLVAVLAAFATGESAIRGAEELRVKESDRIAAVTAGLRAIGVEVEEHEDGWTIAGKPSARGGVVDARKDHRIAMAFLIAGLRTKQGVTVEGVESVRASDPCFLPRLRGLAR
jgi:3-phosphoshikimate 1-carboxyvinyltransferase